MTMKKKKQDKNNQIEDLAIIVQGGFSEMNGRFSQIDGRFNDMDKRFDAIESRLDIIENKLIARHDREIEHLRDKVLQLEVSFKSLEKRVK
jgi:predicted nuclease with TOPRIM domain